MLTCLICIPLFFNEVTFFTSSYFRFDGLFKVINSIKALNYILWVILIFSEGLYLNYLANEFKIVNQNTHFPLAMFVLLNAFSIVGLQLSQVHFLNLFLLVVLHQMLLIYNERKANFTIFNAAFFVGIGAVLYLPFIVLMLLLWFVIRYIKPFYWKEYIVSIFGVVTPFLYVAFYYFMMNQLTINNLFNLPTTALIEHSSTTKLSWHFIIFIVLLLIFSVVYSVFHIQHLVVKTQKFITIILLLMIITALSQLIIEPVFSENVISFQFILIPLTVLISIVFTEFKKQKITQGIFYLLMLFLLGNYLI